MTSKRNCLHCQTEFEPKRSSKKFCKDSCRVMFNRKKKEAETLTSQYLAERRAEREAIEGQTKAVETEIKQLRETLNQYQTELASLSGKEKSLSQQLATQTAKMSRLTELLQMSDADLYNDQLNERYQQALKEKHSFPSFHKLTDHDFTLTTSFKEEIDAVAALRFKLGMDKIFLEEEMFEVKKKSQGLQDRRVFLEASIPNQMEFIREANKRLLGLDQLRFKPPKPLQEPINHPVQKKAVSAKHLPSAITGEALMEMEFASFQLEGELGRFMGDLERDMMAIALTGDSGAGKSTFSFALAKLFLQADFKVCYFSLEMGIGKKVQQLMRENGCQDLTLFRKGKLAEVKKATKEFDVIFVDSFSKLDCKADAFEDLRQSFPDTMFVVIFQKTNRGTIRGGASIKYDSTATIDIQVREDGERVAVMEKSRYGTQDWEYFIQENRTIPNA